MSAGLYPMSVVAAYLGKRAGDMRRLMTEDGLPVIMVPTRQKMLPKVPLVSLYKWLMKRSSGAVVLSLEELASELDRAGARLTAKRWRVRCSIGSRTRRPPGTAASSCGPSAPKSATRSAAICRTTA